MGKRHKWTKEKCHTLALDCKSRVEFHIKYSKAYDASSKRRGDWMNEICLHMIELQYFWTKEECHKLALDCKTKSEFKRRYSKAYNASIKPRGDWMDEICLHMNGNHHWTKEECHSLALDCLSRSEFSIKYPKAYTASTKQAGNWMDEICGHMIKNNKQ
jgi:hypothetical protein